MRMNLSTLKSPPTVLVVVVYFVLTLVVTTLLQHQQEHAVSPWLGGVQGLELTEETMEEWIPDETTVFFLYFFNPHTTMGCYECELMDNNWKHVMDAYEGSVNMVVAEIDCAEEEDLCADEFHVQVRSRIFYKLWRRLSYNCTRFALIDSNKKKLIHPVSFILILFLSVITIQ